jgi:hypothetical protein
VTPEEAVDAEADDLAYHARMLDVGGVGFTLER